MTLTQCHANALSDVQFSMLREWINLKSVEEAFRNGVRFYTPTYWIDRVSEDHLPIEKILLDLLKYYQKCNETECCAGIEWWLSVQDPNLDADLLLDFHFDQDLISPNWPFQKSTDCNYLPIRHPIWSSVLFLRTLSVGDLIVTDQVRGPSNNTIPANPSVMEFVRPQENLLTVFDGRMYHGIAGKLWRVVDQLPLRVAVAINVWDEKPDVPHLLHSRDFQSQIHSR